MNAPHTTLRHLTLASLVAAAALLGACSKNDDRTAGEKLDSAVATAERKTDEVKAEAKEGMAEAKADATAAANQVGQAFDDAAITASVNAELAKDNQLSALKINVDTSNGAVTLRGTAPDATSRERATTLAASVKGVSSVNNQLEVRG